MPAVGFQFGFTGAPGADAAAQPGEVLAAARQPGQTVAQLGQLHLEPSFAAPGPGRKDVQDQHGAVHHCHAGDIADVPGLAAGEFAVKDEHIRLQPFQILGEFPEPSRAHHGGGIGGGTLLNGGGSHLHPGGAGQFLQLQQGGFSVIFAGVHRHQNGTGEFFGIVVHHSQCPP